MTEHAPGGDWSPDLLPASMSAAAVTRLHGGVANSTWLVDLVDGTRVVVKGGVNALRGADPGHREAICVNPGVVGPQH